MDQVGDPRVTEEHQSLDNLPLGRSIVAFDHIQNLSHSNEVIASIGVRFVVGGASVAIGVVV